MSQDLQRALSDAAERTGKGKNPIIIEALVKYLSAMERQSLAEEARRQSELVSRNEADRLVRTRGHFGMEIKRGDVVICAAPGEYGEPRPAVVVQSALFNGTHSTVVVCLITSHLEDATLFRIPVPAGRATGLEK
jgi:predicted DNA-binding protein